MTSISKPNLSTPGASSSRSTVPSLVDIARLPRMPNMQNLDRKAFDLRIPILSARVEAAKVAELRKHPDLRGYFVDLPKHPIIVRDPEDSRYRLLRFRVKSEDDLPEATRKALHEESLGVTSDELVVGYDYWDSSDILNAILPIATESDLAPSSFTQTGHIGHVNLREEWLPYKHLIGQVFLDKTPKLRTIVNKLDQIHATYRYFDMEVLAGEADFVTTLSESHCTFTFDFSQVYWNSRLQGEHERLVSLLPPKSVVADVMAGVGPFAIPAAKKGCLVLGNDLNPESVRWMRENRVQNRVEETLRVTEIDGREFIRRSPLMVWEEPFSVRLGPPVSKRQVMKAERHKRGIAERTIGKPNPQPTTQIESAKDHKATTAPVDTTSSTAGQQSIETKPQLIDHYIMNLPDSALTFLDAFRGLLTPLKKSGGQEFEDRIAKAEGGGRPLIHVYCFTREMEEAPACRDICERASSALGYTLTPEAESFHLHLVRRVAPNKDMYCLTFRLPHEVAFAE